MANSELLLKNSLLTSIDSNKLLYDNLITKIYKRRWLMLGLYVLFGVANLLQCAQYTVVANIMVNYYGVSDLDVAWSAMTYMATYIIFSFPGLCILDLLGIRKTLVIGMVVMSIGAWIKVISVKSTLYWLALIGQTLVAIIQVLVLPIPPKIAAMWFSDNEVATACSIGVAGPQLGMAIGFLITPVLIQNGTTEVIKEGLYMSTVCTALFCTLVGTAIYFFYEEFPPRPPSLTQLQAAESRIEKKSTFLKAAKNLITNRSFVLFLIVFGVNIGIQMPYSVFINQITLHYHPNASSSVAGSIAFLILLFVVIGALLSGILIDKFRNYRLLAIATFALNICTFLLVCLVFGDVLWLFTLAFALLGLSVGCIYSLGYEVGVELTFPEPEEISGGLLSCSYQLFAICFSYLYNLLFQSIGFTYANFIFLGVLLVTDILLFFINFHLRRQTAVDSIKYIKL